MYTNIKGHINMKISKFTHNLVRIIMDFFVTNMQRFKHDYKVPVG